MTKIILVLEAWAGDEKLFETNLIYAFTKAGIKINSIRDLENLGVKILYVFEGVLEGAKLGAKTIEEKSLELEKKLNIYKEAHVYVLMGDTAIKAINYIDRRQTGKRMVIVGSTYKIRNGKFYLNKIRLLPSYLPKGKNFVIEKSKQRMIIEDLKLAFSLVF